jgi:hypothetical protein
LANILSVTGMHRSGTSLVMSWLDKCGLQISDGNIVPAGIGNERGHFEDSEFFQEQVKIISKNVAKSKGWIITKDSQTKNLYLDKLTCTEMIQKRNKAYSSWGWKDPRTVFLIDQWVELIPNLKILFIWRPFEDVLDSLIRRAKKRKNENVVQISIVKAVKLWKISNRNIIKNFEKYRERAIVSPLCLILKNDSVLLEEINNKFSMELKYFPISNIYDPTMCHKNHSSKYRFIKIFDGEIKKISCNLKKISFL